MLTKTQSKCCLKVVQQHSVLLICESMPLNDLLKCNFHVLPSPTLEENGFSSDKPSKSWYFMVFSYIYILSTHTCTLLTYYYFNYSHVLLTKLSELILSVSNMQRWNEYCRSLLPKPVAVNGLDVVTWCHVMSRDVTWCHVVYLWWNKILRSWDSLRLFKSLWDIASLCPKQIQADPRNKGRHDARAQFLYVRTGGIFGNVFVDFGPSHVLVDANGQASEKSWIWMSWTLILWYFEIFK